jgi:virginiamycin B lyase
MAHGAARRTGLVADSALVVQEWSVPRSMGRSAVVAAVDTSGSSYDVVPSGNGGAWIASSTGAYVASFDPASQRFKPYALPRGTHPLGLSTVGAFVWIAPAGRHELLRLDPATGVLRSFNIPDSTVRDVSTLLFAAASPIGWFIAPSTRLVGRFDSSNGGVMMWQMLPGSDIGSLVIDSQGRPWYSETGRARLGTVQPGKWESNENSLANRSACPSALAVGSDNGIWYGDACGGHLCRFNPADSTSEEFPLPEGAAARAGAIAVDDNRIWVAETGVQPNRLVAFDLRTRAWVASVPLDSGPSRAFQRVRLDGARHQLWFTTNRGTIGRLRLRPQASSSGIRAP